MGITMWIMWIKLEKGFPLSTSREKSHIIGGISINSE